MIKLVCVEQVSRENNGVASITIKKKTHGFLPLFVSQFFFLVATLGIGAVLFVLPEKQLKEIQDVSPSLKPVFYLCNSIPRVNKVRQY
jgi:hypothetical protein